jgi:hypothetical protein
MRVYPLRLSLRHTARLPAAFVFLLSAAFRLLGLLPHTASFISRCQQRLLFHCTRSAAILLLMGQLRFSDNLPRNPAGLGRFWGQDRFLPAVRAWTGALRLEGGMQVPP